jgi:hypothetical protein
MKNRIKNWCFPPTLIAVLIMLFLTLIHRVYGDSLKQLDPLSLESSHQKSASNNHRASIDNLVQIGFRNGFAGKGSFDKIIKVLNVESTNELNSYFGAIRAGLAGPVQNTKLESAFLFGLEHVDRKEMSYALTIFGANISFETENSFFRSLDYRLQQPADDLTPYLEDLAKHMVQVRGRNTSGKMISEPTHRLSHVLEVARLDSFQKPLFSGKILQQVGDLIDGEMAQYDPLDTIAAMRFMVLESRANENDVIQTIIRLISPQLVEKTTTATSDEHTLRWQSEVPRALIWYLCKIRDESPRALKVLETLESKGSPHIQWIQQNKLKLVDENSGFKNPIENTQKVAEKIRK